MNDLTQKHIEHISPMWPFQPDNVEHFAWWANAFTKQECQKIIETGKDLTLRESVISVPGADNEFGLNLEYRNSNVSFINSRGNEWLFAKASNYIQNLNSRYFNFDLWGIVEGLQFTEYVAPTGKYDPHVDRLPNGIVRKLSFVIQLSEPDEYEGGELHILLGNKPNVMMKNVGDMIVFPGYMLHQVTPVTKGTRYSLVGWVTGKPFR